MQTNDPPFTLASDVDFAMSKAWKLFRETGDQSELIRLGVFTEELKPNA